jgi:cytochrome c-type biogenesis protein CcmH
MRLRLVILTLAAALCMGAAASDPSERLANPVQEAHARSLFRQIRCLVCQNESIDESEAPLADDLRKLVRQQIVEGRRDDQIRQFLVQRFGAFVLLKPPFDLGDAPLWLTPFAIVGVGVAAIAWRSARPPAPLEPPLNTAERVRLEALTEAPPPSDKAELEGTDTVPPQPRLTKGARA